MAAKKPDELPHIDVAYVARLARLSLSADDVTVFGRQLDQVLEYVDQIRKVDVSDVDPTAHTTPLRNVFREDQPVADAVDENDVAANAPRWRDHTFIVPRIIE